MLAKIGWRQSDLMRALEDASGQKVKRETISNYVLGKVGIPPGVALAVRLIEAALDAGFTVPKPAFTDRRKKARIRVNGKYASEAKS